MIALGMGLLSVDHKCIMRVYHVYICMYIIASSPKRLPFPRQTMENIQVGIWPFWRGKPVFLPFAFVGGYSCHLALNELLLGVRIIILWVRFDVFFSNMVGLGWGTKSVPQIIWHFTEKCQVILGIHDMDHQCMTSWTSWRRETTILRFSIGTYIHLRPLFIFPVRAFPVLLVAMLDERKKVGPRDFQPNTTWRPRNSKCFHKYQGTGRWHLPRLGLGGHRTLSGMLDGRWFVVGGSWCC